MTGVLDIVIWIALGHWIVKRGDWMKVWSSCQIRMVSGYQERPVDRP